MSRAWMICTALAACGGTGTGGGTLTATWSLQTASGGAGACLAGFETMKVTVTAVDAEFMEEEGSASIGLFPCTDGTGTVPLPAAVNAGPDVDVRWEQVDSTGGTVVASDLATELQVLTRVDASSGDTTIGTTFITDGGYVWFDWDLYGMVSQKQLDTCSGAGVDRIDVTLTNMATSESRTLMNPCSGMAGTPDGIVLPAQGLGGVITALPAGSYTYAATAVMGSTTVGMTTESDGITVRSSNAIDSGAIELSLALTTR